MFQPGDLVVYNTTGVCRVEAISRLDVTGPDRERQFYQLKPLYQDGFIYTPVDNTKVFIRPVITREEAEALIDRIPSIQAEPCQAHTLQALAQQYQSSVQSHNCESLIALMMSIYAKRKQAEAQKRRLGLVDERYMKQAEQLLYGELSAALNIPFDQIQPYIAQRVETAK